MTEDTPSLEPSRGSICRCGLARSYHPRLVTDGHEYEPRYPARRAAPAEDTRPPEDRLRIIRAELVSFAEPYEGANPTYQRGKQYGLQLAIGAIDDALVASRRAPADPAVEQRIADAWKAGYDHVAQFYRAALRDPAPLGAADLRAWAVHHDHCGYRLAGAGRSAEVVLPREWLGPGCTCGLDAALASPSSPDAAPAAPRKQG